MAGARVKEKLVFGSIWPMFAGPPEGRGSALLSAGCRRVCRHEFAHIAYVPEWPDTLKTPGNNPTAN